MDTSDFETDDATAEKLRAELKGTRLKRIALKKRRFRNIIIGVTVIASAIVVVPKIDKYIDVRTRWNMEHSPSMAIIFEPQNYLNGVEAIKKIDKPFHQCDCVVCKWGNMIDDKWVAQSSFVITEAAENLLQKTGLRYQRKDIGYKKGCSFHVDDVARNNFVNW